MSGAVAAALHQATLSAGLAEAIHTEARGTSLLSRNKEGVFSLPGFWALALMSTGLARSIHGSAAAAAAAAASGSLTHARWALDSCLSRRRITHGVWSSSQAGKLARGSQAA